MNAREAEKNRRALLDELSRLDNLLDECVEPGWSAYFAEARRLIEQRDFRGVEIVRESFGGTGSFNDLVLHPANGHHVSEMREPNERLDNIRAELFRLANALRGYQASL